MTDLRQAAQAVVDRWDSFSWSWSEKTPTADLIAALRKALEQQAEPICPECKAAVLYECVACSSNNYPPKQQAEPVAMRLPKVGDKVICLEDESLGTVESLTAGGSPDIAFNDGSRGTYLLREFAELFSYVAAAQRQWVGLEPEEILDLFDRNNVYGSKWIEFARTVEAKLKERNYD